MKERKLKITEWSFRRALGFLALLLLVLGSAGRLLAEEPGGGFQPPPPVEGAEDDEFAPDSGFGFAPPDQGMAAPPTPPSGDGGGGSGSGGAPTAPPPAPSRRAANPATPPAAAAKPGNGATQKPAQKLADYLELDPAVRGLEVKNFDLPDKELKDVVTLISKWTGKNFIIDGKLRGKISIMGPSQVTLQEAYQAFLSALEANGFTTVQSGKFIRIIESSEARRAPVKTYAGDYAPADDNFITRIFQLRYINADEVQKEFRDLVTRQGKLFAYEPTNSIIITDTGSNIQRIKEILNTLDVKNFETTLHVLRVKNGSAKTIADMLGEIYGDSNRPGSGGVRTFRRSALERTRGGGIISKVIPDEQTNSLIILANQAGYRQLVSIVDRLDVKVTDTGRIHVYYCEYAKAKDLAETMAALSQGSSGGAGRSSNRRTTATSPNSPGAPGGTGTSPSISGTGSPVSAELEGGVRITSDDATNALVITASSSDFRTLKRVLKKLDIPRLQVFVETAILELSLDDKEQRGVNAGIFRPGNAGFAGGFIGDTKSLASYIAQNPPPSGLTVPIPIGNTVQTTIAGQSLQVSTFMGLLNLLTTNTATTVLSTPQILALDNEEAIFKVQDEIPVQSTFTTTGTSTASAAALGTGTISTLKTGIEIKLTPQVNAASKTIRLKIEQSVDSVRSNNDVPEALQNIQKAKTSRATNTSVVVKDQDYVMLGGLISDKVDETENKVPILGDIPILGWLFKGKTFQTVKTNLVILLRPRIIDSTRGSNNIIEENLKKRSEFIEKYTGGEDQHEKSLTELNKTLGEQKKRGSKEPIFDYRNNDEDEDPKPRPGERSEIGKPSSPREKPAPQESGFVPTVPPPGMPGDGLQPPPGFETPPMDVPPPAEDN